METRKNTLKAALAAGEMQIGLWASSCSNIVVEVLAGSNPDWIVLDTEHSANELPNLVSQMQAMQASSAAAIVRPAWNDKVLIKRILDAGAQSIIVPYVQNASEAEAAVAATRYPPEGIRGVAGSTRASNYGRNKSYLHNAVDEIAVIVQIETAEALSNIDAIAAVDGVDSIFIGPSDLSASLGHIGNAEHPDVQDAIKTAITKLKAVGKAGGILAFNPDHAKRYIDWGFQFIAVGSDLSMVVSGSDALVQQFK